MNSDIKILIIDHDPAGRRATRAVLEKAGYSIDGAASAAGGLRLALRHPPALLLLEAELPDLDGIKACKQMKAELQLAGTLIVLFSRLGGDSRVRVRGLKAGAVEFLTFPIDERELLARLQALLRVRAAGTGLLRDNVPASSKGANVSALQDASRRNADESLREAHDRLLMVLDSIPADVYVANMKTYEILFVNQHMRASFGGNLVGQVCWKPFRGTAGPCPHCTNARLVDRQGHPTEGVSWEGQNPITRRWYTNYDRAIRWVRGELARVQIAVDITERKLAEGALQEKERLLSDTQRLAHIGSWQYDLATDRVTWSEETYRIYGVAPEAFVPARDSLIGLLHPDDRPVMGEWIANSLAGNPSPAIEIRTIRPDGTVRDLLGQGELLYDDKHRPIRLVGTVQDITENKRAQDEVRQKNKQLTMLNQLGQAQNSLAPLAEILERISNLIGQVYDNQNLYIALYDEATNLVSFPIYWLDGERGEPIEERPFSNGLTEYVIRTRAPVLIPDNLLETLNERGVDLIGTKSKCYLGVPILLDERVIGVIAVQDYEHENVFNANHVELLSTIASQAAISIKNARLYEALQQELTERKRAEEALRASEEKLRSIFRVAPTGIGVVHDRILLDVNTRICEMTGYSNEELIGQNARMLYPTQEDYDFVGREKYRQIAEKGSGVVETRWQAKDGSILDIRLASTPIDAADMSKGVTFTALDITERKRTETALRKSEERYRTLAEAAHEMISVVNRQWQVEYVNEYAARQFGGSPQDLIGKKLADIFPAENASRQQNNLQKVFNSGQPAYIEAPTVFRGETIWLGTWLAPIKGQNETSNTILIISRDITERKRIEEELRESENKYQLVFENSGTANTIFDTECRVILQNSMSKRMTAPVGTLGKTALQIFGPEQGPIVTERMRRVLTSGTSEVFETEFSMPSGRRWIRSSYLPLSNEQHVLIGIQVISQDITTQKRAEEAIRQLNAELEQRVEERTRELHQAQEQLVRQEKLAVLGQLAGGVGHELRNPLTVINNAVYYLKLIQPEADETVREYLGMIENETHSAEKIIADLLDFARIKSVDREPVAAADLVRHVLERYPVPESITAALILPPGLPKAYADPRQMEQVLGNLVVNAYQAMPVGGKLTISAACQKDELAISIHDNGMGISPENMNKLFEPLFTTKPRGIGLGLAVSRKLAEANGGRIEVRSEPGKGSTFTLVLPLQAASHG